MEQLPCEFQLRSKGGISPVPIVVMMGALGSNRVLAGLPRRNPPPFAPHEAFTFAFRPGQRLLQRLALVVAQAHLGESGLCVDLLSDLRWRRRCGDRQGL